MADSELLLLATPSAWTHCRQQHPPGRASNHHWREEGQPPAMTSILPHGIKAASAWRDMVGWQHVSE